MSEEEKIPDECRIAFKIMSFKKDLEDIIEHYEGGAFQEMIEDIIKDQELTDSQKLSLLKYAFEKLDYNLRGFYQIYMDCE